MKLLYSDRGSFGKAHVLNMVRSLSESDAQHLDIIIMDNYLYYIVLFVLF